MRVKLLLFVAVLLMFEVVVLISFCFGPAVRWFEADRAMFYCCNCAAATLAALWLMAVL